MLTKKVTDDDSFMALSSSAQALYLHLSMSADDDGFSNQVSLSMFKAHASVQDLEALLDKRYIYQFENGVIVIKHWRMANALRKDRYNQTVFLNELAQLKLEENGEYTWLPNGCQMVASRLPQDKLSKDNLTKDKLSECNTVASDEPKHQPKHKYGEYNHVMLTDKEYEKLHNDYPDKADEAINFLDEYIEMKGYKAKSHYLCIRKWVIDALKEREQKKQKSTQAPKNCGTASAQRYNNYMQNDYSDDQLKSIEKMLLATSGTGRV